MEAVAPRPKLEPSQNGRRSGPWARVVIVNYNGGDFIRRVVQALAYQTLPDFETVIVDNASTDGSIEALQLPDARFSIKRLTQNVGFARGCNLGAAGASTCWLAMLNPDAFPESDWLERLKEATERYPEAAMFGSTQALAEQPSRLDGAGDCYSIYGIAWRGGRGAPLSSSPSDGYAFSPCAAAALYRRDAFESSGGFAEEFFCYLEDVDLGFRLRLMGHECVQVANARVRHVGSAISGALSDFTLYLSFRNGVWLLWRCMPGPLLLLAAPLHLAAMIWYISRTRHILPTAPRLRGLWSGFVSLPRVLRERNAIQSARRVKVATVARLLVWDPHKVARTAIVLRQTTLASAVEPA